MEERGKYLASLFSKYRKTRKQAERELWNLARTIVSTLPEIQLELLLLQTTALPVSEVNKNKFSNRNIAKFLYNVVLSNDNPDRRRLNIDYRRVVSKVLRLFVHDMMLDHFLHQSTSSIIISDLEKERRSQIVDQVQKQYISRHVLDLMKSKTGTAIFDLITSSDKYTVLKPSINMLAFSIFIDRSNFKVCAHKKPILDHDELSDLSPYLKSFLVFHHQSDYSQDVPFHFFTEITSDNTSSSSHVMAGIETNLITVEDGAIDDTMSMDDAEDGKVLDSTSMNNRIPSRNKNDINDDDEEGEFRDSTSTNNGSTAIEDDNIVDREFHGSPCPTAATDGGTSSTLTPLETPSNRLSLQQTVVYQLRSSRENKDLRLVVPELNFEKSQKCFKFTRTHKHPRNKRRHSDELVMNRNKGDSDSGTSRTPSIQHLGKSTYLDIVEFESRLISEFMAAVCRIRKNCDIYNVKFESELKKVSNCIPSENYFLKMYMGDGVREIFEKVITPTLLRYAMEHRNNRQFIHNDFDTTEDHGGADIPEGRYMYPLDIEWVKDRVSPLHDILRVFQFVFGHVTHFKNITGLSLLHSEPNCGIQTFHTDYVMNRTNIDPTDMLGDPVMSYSVLVAMQPDTRIQIMVGNQELSIDLNVGELIIMCGNLLHRDCNYSKENFSLFFYIEDPRWVAPNM